MLCLIIDLARRLWFYVFDRVILYPLIGYVASKFGLQFMNLGYWPTNNKKDDEMKELVESIHGEYDPDLPHYYLYEKPLSVHPDYPELKRLSILDVGCGHGKGVEWIKRAHPQVLEVKGVDRILVNRRANLYVGQAEALPFYDEKFDIILNVESSHLYADCSQFFAECFRVLKKGGSLCWIDLRYSEKIPDVRLQAAAVGFRELHFEDVTENVLEGIERTASRYDRILNAAPWYVSLFRNSIRATYCAPGTHTHERFVRREKRYLMARWEKQSWD